MAEQLETSALDSLLDVVRAEGYQVVGPTLRDGAIVYDELHSASDLPVGWTDRQQPGSYRLERRSDQAVFGYNVGPHSWKQFLFPPRERLVQLRRREPSEPADGKPEWCSATDQGPALALLGVRGCELSAIAVQDKVLTGGPFVDSRYRLRRDRCLLIAVNCTEAGDLCFCDSMGSGPRANGEYDLRLTELGERLLLEAGTPRGRKLLSRIPTQPAADALEDRADDAIERCRRSMGRQLDTTELPARLMGNLEHPRWEQVAERCLSCGSCTSVCPTCFCSNVVDTSDLSASEAGRERVWDSCFSAEHSTIHGAQFRAEGKYRYRQWLTHKLATWTSQFGQSGCVGCGRCIAWCPVGIDLTEEATAVASGPGAPLPLPPTRNYSVGTTDGQLPEASRVLEVSRDTPDVVTLVLEAPAGYTHEHGQFNMLSLPGIGDVPISISGCRDGLLEHTVRAVGATTKAISELRPGMYLGLRGPFGRGWPLAEGLGRPVVVIAGGIGLAPLRTAIREVAQRRSDFRSLRVLYGTRSPSDILYEHELLGWMQLPRVRVHVTVDRGDRAWAGNIGVVTKLVRRKRMPLDGLYLVCGPEIMMRYVLADLRALGVPDERIYLSMERNMRCAAGLCGRCQYGPHFICKDGPVFRYDEIASILGKPGF